VGPTVTTTVEEMAIATLPHDVGVLGRYVLLETLGHGGMGVVWKSYDPMLDRNVALKLMVSSSEVRGAVVAEAQAMAKVQHPNVVTVYDAGIHPTGDHHLAYIAMELIAGRTMKGWLDEAEHSIDDKLDMFVLAGRGLEAAHEAGLVHRDFKPSNVLVGDDGRVRVSDFGLSVVGREDRAATGSPFAGTPRYMAPEQLHGVRAQAASDQFAFCVALYEAVFDEAPFAIADDASVAELRAAIVGTPKPPIRSRLQARLAPIVLRGLSIDPSQRWKSMGELLAAIGTVRAARRRRLAVAGAVGATVIALGLVGWWQLGSSALDCDGAGDGITALWHPQRRQALTAAFAPFPGGPAAVDRVSHAIDDWSRRWTALRVEQCEADRNGERSSPSLVVRRDCLDRRLGELDGLLQILDKPDATVVTFASSAAYSVTAPESCMSLLPPVGAPAPPLLQQSVAAAHAQIDRVATLDTLGKEKVALDEAKIAIAAAAKIDWAPVTADAQLLLGRTALNMHDVPMATDAFYKAQWAAERAGDDRIREAAAIGLFDSNLFGSDYPAAGRWLETAKAIAHRMPPTAHRDATLAFDEMELALYLGQFSNCLRAGDDGLRLAEAEGPEAPIVVQVLITLAQCERSLEHLEDKAVAHMQRALALSEKVNGHDHQQTAMVLSELGIMARKAHRYDEALARYRDSLAIREALSGADHPDCAGLHNNISNVYRDLKRPADARAELDRAMAIWMKKYGPDSPAIAHGLRNLARLSADEGHFAEAEPLLRRSLAILRKTRPAGHREVAVAADALASNLLVQNNKDALPLLEEALATFEHDHDSARSEKAEARFRVARARVDFAVHPEGAIALAEAACNELGDPDMKSELAECRAWLAKHPR
jgi:tetratricopeptide (TPR) repeat protein